MALKTRPFKFGEFVKTAEDAETYIDAALEEVGPEHLTSILRAIADSEGMTALAERSGLTRAGLTGRSARKVIRSFPRSRQFWRPWACVSALFQRMQPEQGPGRKPQIAETPGVERG